METPGQNVIALNVCLTAILSRLKCVLQLLAAAQARRDVVYFTFGNKNLQREICIFHSNLLLYGCTVGDVSF